jgi:hypothetical protein
MRLLNYISIVAIVAVVMIGMMIPNISAQDLSDKTSEPSFFSNIFQFFDSWFPENNSKSNLKSTDTSSNISAKDFLVDSYITKPTFKVKSEAVTDARVEQEYKAVMHEVVMDKIAADESVYYGVPNTNSLSTDKMKKQLEEKMRVTYGLVPKDVDVMWMGDSIFFDPKVHENCSELFTIFDFLGVDKFRIMYVQDGAALNCLVKTSEELEARAESITQQLEAKLLKAKLLKAKLLKAKSAADNVETHNAFKSDSTSNSPSYNSPSYNSPSYNSPSYNPSVEPKNANPLGTMSIDRSPHFSSFPEITKKNLNSPSFNVGNFDQPSLPPSLPPVYDSPRTPEPAYNPAKEAARSGIGQNSQPAYSAPSVPNPFEK